MDANRREVAINKKVVEYFSTSDSAHENNYLIEMEGVQQIVQLSVLLSLVQFDVILD
jgi:hypothetical protein